MDAYMKKATKKDKKKAKHAAKVFTELSDDKVVVLSPEALRQKGSKLLAALVTGVRLEQAGKGSGITGEALAKVITKVDEMREALKKEQALEQKMRDLCIKEDNEAAMEIERMTTEQQGYNITKQRETKVINDCDHTIEKINATINEMKDEMDKKKVERQKQHEEFRKSVKDQEASQKVLYKAKQQLQNFYAGKSALLQKPKSDTSLPSASLPTIAAISAPKVNTNPPKVLSKPKVAGPDQQKVNHAAVVAKTKVSHAVIKAKATTTHKTGTNGTKAHEDPDVLGEKTKMPEFSKPTADAHGGGVGVIGILDLLIEESQTLIEEIVEAEETAANAYIEELNDTKRAIEEKDREIVALEQDKGTAEVGFQEAKELDVSLLKEMEEMYKYRELLHGKCGYLLENFEKSQAARAAEIQGLMEAKHQLQGMVSSLQMPGAATSAAGAMVQKHQALEGQFLARQL